MASEASAPKSRPPTRLRRPGAASERCAVCGRPFDRFGRCRRRKCPAYTHVWVRDQRERLTVNLPAFSAGPRAVCMTAVTAPGADLLPWDKSACREQGRHRCTGTLGCRVADADAYNLTAPRRFSAMHRTASRRASRRSGCEFILLARVWEIQKRGVLHVHLVLACETEPQHRGAAAYARTLSGLARSNGFGHVDRAIKPTSGETAAVYCGKEISETIKASTCPGRVVWISHRLTAITGCTTRALRQRRYSYALAHAGKSAND
jgi:hypothetical protein